MNKGDPLPDQIEAGGEGAGVGRRLGERLVHDSGSRHIYPVCGT